jgi:hypothetical protein
MPLFSEMMKKDNVDYGNVIYFELNTFGNSINIDFIGIPKANHDLVLCHILYKNKGVKFIQWRHFRCRTHSPAEIE